MPTALSFTVVSLALLSSGSILPPAVRSLSLQGGRGFTNLNGTFDHDGAALHSIDVFKYVD